MLSAQDVEKYRKNYALAVENKLVCEAMISELEKYEDLPLYKAYLGAFETIWANHLFNPISKLKTFKKGKANLEAAIKADPANIEIVFLRYSVQSNAPKFLGYHKNTQEDKNFILKNKNSVKESSLKELLNIVGK